jgi:hypothetical protein
MRKSANGKDIFDFSVNHRLSDGKGGFKYDYYNCMVVGEGAQKAMQQIEQNGCNYAHIEGELTHNTYTGKDGKDKFASNVFVTSFKLHRDECKSVPNTGDVSFI